MILRHAVTMALFAWIGLGVSYAQAQTVINIPPRVVHSREVFEDATLNIRDGATIRDAGARRSEVNFLGGQVTEGFSVYDRSQVNLEAGLVENLWIEGGSQTSQSGGILSSLTLSPNASAFISGGIVGRINGNPNARITLSGYNFRINGQVVDGLDEVGDMVSLDNVPEDATITGILADGTPFGNFRAAQQQPPGKIEFQRSPTPMTPEPMSLLISEPVDTGPIILGENQSVTVGENGGFSNWLVAGPGSRVEVHEGGLINGSSNFVGAEVIINGGTMDGNKTKAQVFDNATVTMNGGSLGRTSFYGGAELDVTGGDLYDIHAFSGATLNLREGMYRDVDGFRDSSITMSGGTALSVSSAGDIHISGGTVHVFDAHSESANVTFSGGRFHSGHIRVSEGGHLTILGGDFKIDGVPVSGLNEVGDSVTRRIAAGAMLSGTFENGTPFAIDTAPQVQHDGRPGAFIAEPVTLTISDLPSIDTTNIVVPDNLPPLGLRRGQTLILNEGGDLGDFFTVTDGAALTVNGGTVGEELKIVQSQATFNGGELSYISVFDGHVDVGGDANWGGGYVRGPNSTVTVRGGTWGGRHLRLESGATFSMEGGAGRTRLESYGASVSISAGDLTEMLLTDRTSAVISGGSVSESVRLFLNSELRVEEGDIQEISVSENSSLVVAGGSVERLYAGENAIVDVIGGNVDSLSVGAAGVLMSGGTLGDYVSVGERSTLHLVGFDFRLNGIPMVGLVDEGDSFQLSGFEQGSILTGTFSDGTPFNIAYEDHFNFGVEVPDRAVTLRQSSVPSLPSQINVSGESNVTQLGAAGGQTVTVAEGGVLGDNFFAAPGSTVVFLGGQAGANFEAMDSLVTIDGGQVGDHMDVFQGATVHLRDGSIGQYFEVHDGGFFRMDGGEVGFLAQCSAGEVQISGGLIQENFAAQQGCDLTLDGGRIAQNFEARDSQIEVNGGHIERLSLDGSQLVINGGWVHVVANAETVTQLRGGSIGDYSRFENGAIVEAIGGAFGDGITNFTDGTFQLHGFGFEVDGIPLDGLESLGDAVTTDLSSAHTISGVLSDGTAFVFSKADLDTVGTMTFVRSPVPANPSEIEVTGIGAIQGVYAGQTLSLRETGSLPDNFGAGRDSVVNILGGSVGNNLEAYGAEINISGGQVTGGLDAFSGTQINLTGGTVAQVTVFHQSSVTIDGGEISDLGSLHNSQVNVNGGHITRLSTDLSSQTNVTGGEILQLSVSDSASVRISGGRVASLATWAADSQVLGSDFKLNGQPIENLTMVGNTLPVSMARDDILTGVLADGTPFSFSQASGDSINNSLVLTVVDVPPAEPADFLASRDGVPLALGQGQSLTLDGGQAVPEMYVVGSGASLTVLDGASVGNRLETFGSRVDVLGGTVDGQAQFRAGSSLHLADGVVEAATIHRDATLTMVGGTLSEAPTTLPGSTISIASGEIASSLRRLPSFSGDVTISGGTFMARQIAVNGHLTLAGGERLRFSRGEEIREPIPFDFAGGSSVLIEGTAFFINGEELTDLPLDEIVDLDLVAVSGVLADGSAFDIRPNGLQAIQVRRTSLLGDFNTDGQWTASDVDQLCGRLAAGIADMTMDLNRDQSFDHYDLQRILELAESRIGDTDLNGQVDFSDFLELSKSFGGEGSWSDGDFDCDASIGFNDFLALAGNFNNAQVQAVPEPGQLVGNVLGFGILLLWRNRRWMRACVG